MWMVPEYALVGLDRVRVPLPSLVRLVPASGAVTVRAPPPVTVKLVALNVPPVPASRLHGLAPVLMTVPIVRLPSSVTDAPGLKSRTNPAAFPAPEGTVPPCQFAGLPQLPPATAAEFQKALWARAE